MWSLSINPKIFLTTSIPNKICFHLRKIRKYFERTFRHILWMWLAHYNFYSQIDFPESNGNLIDSNKLHPCQYDAKRSSEKESSRNTDDQMTFLTLACTVIGEHYYGDPVKLQSFVSSIELLEKIARTDHNIEILRLFVISRLVGKAYDAVSDSMNSIDNIKTSLIRNIEKTSFKLIKFELIALSCEKQSILEFVDKATGLAESLEHSLRDVGFPTSLARTETIEAVREICVNKARSSMLKIILKASTYTNVQEIFTKFLSYVSERKNQRQIKRKCSNYFHEKESGEENFRKYPNDTQRPSRERHNEDSIRFHEQTRPNDEKFQITSTNSCNRRSKNYYCDTSSGNYFPKTRNEAPYDGNLNVKCKSDLPYTYLRSNRSVGVHKNDDNRKMSYSTNDAEDYRNGVYINRQQRCKRTSNNDFRKCGITVSASNKNDFKQETSSRDHPDRKNSSVKKVNAPNFGTTKFYDEKVRKGMIKEKPKGTEDFYCNIKPSMPQELKTNSFKDTNNSYKSLPKIECFDYKNTTKPIEIERLSEQNIEKVTIEDIGSEWN